MCFYPYLFLANIVVLHSVLYHATTSFNNSETSTLQLTHVLFRHGDRTPSLSGLWKANKYYNESYYEPYGYAQLTNKGKMTQYRLGTRLRKRYKKFLGDSWNIKMCESWSTDYDRTKMSIALVLAGLFPPERSVLWHEDIPWQPIPYRYLPLPQDKELSSWACPTVVPLIYGDASNMKRLQYYDGLMTILSENIGQEVDYISALELYFGMKIQEELGLPLDDWTKTVYPEPLKTYIVDFYYIETSTRDLKTVMAGYMLKKILTDTVNKINGTLQPQQRKIFLYSGHEVNVAAMLAALELYKLSEPPPYGAYVALEVHRINGIYGIKMFYEDYKRTKPHRLILPGCQKFCLIDDFLRLTAHIIPKTDAECNGDQ